MQQRALACLIFILLIPLAGCQGSGAGTTTPSPAPDASVLPAATPVAGPAPSFAEIQQMVERITKTPEHPDGAPIGDDGITDPKVIEELNVLNIMLKGKHATPGRVGSLVMINMMS